MRSRASEPLLPHDVVFTTLVRAPRDRVYDAITTGQGLDGWFTAGAEVDRRAGGRIHFRWKHWGPERYTGENGGPVLEVRVPERFVFRWRADSGGYETTVTIVFETVPEGTMVRLVETGYENTPRGMQDFINRVSGWACVLTLLKFWVEHGVRY